MTKDGEHFSPDETMSRRDEVVRRMALTPPQPKPNLRPRKETKAGAALAARKDRVRRADQT